MKILKQTRFLLFHLENMKYWATFCQGSINNRCTGNEPALIPRRKRRIKNRTREMAEIEPTFCPCFSYGAKTSMGIIVHMTTFGFFRTLGSSKDVIFRENKKVKTKINSQRFLVIESNFCSYYLKNFLSHL